MEITIGILDDHPVVRKGLMSLLETFTKIRVMLNAGSAEDLLEALKTHHPDILLFDIEMPGLHGRELFTLVREKHPNIKLVPFSTHDHHLIVKDYLRRGAAAFLSKNANLEVIIRTLEEVHKHGHFVDNIYKPLQQSVSHLKPVKAHQPANLSLRELEIIKLICDNYSSQEIALKMLLSVRTIEGYRLSIRAKTGCHTQLELHTFANQHDLI